VLYVHFEGVGGGAANSLRYVIARLPPDVEHMVLCPRGSSAEAFRDSGLRVLDGPRVSVFANGVAAPLRGLRLLDLVRTLYLALREAAPLRRAIGEFKPQIVHLNERGLLHAAKIAKEYGAKVVMHARLPADRTCRWAHSISVRWINKYVDCLVPIDESVRRSLPEVSRCRVVYNPSRGRAGEDPAAYPRVPPEAGISLRVSFIAFLRDFKGVWDLLAAARLLASRRDIVFQVAGGNSRPPEFYSSLFGRACSALGFSPDTERRMREAVARHGLEGQVRMLGHVREITSLLEATDVLLFPSRMNAIGRSVYEAGVHGIPAIVTLKDRVEDIVEHGRTGIIVPEGAPAALAAAVSCLASDTDLRRTLGANARRKYLAQFDAANSAKHLMQIYEMVLAGA